MGFEDIVYDLSFIIHYISNCTLNTCKTRIPFFAQSWRHRGNRGSSYILDIEA